MTAETRQRSVMMVLYHFPPIGGISMSRNVRNAGYLPRHGWIPIVIAPDLTGTGLDDPRSLALVPPGTSVIRTRAIEVEDLRPAVRLVRGMVAGTRSMRSMLSGASRGGPRPVVQGKDAAAAPDTGPSAPAAAIAVPASGVTRETGVTEALARVRRAVFFPDNQVGWLPFGLVAALRAHRRSPVDAVFSTFPPMTSHLIAGSFRRITGVPWVAEFRDPWIGNALEERPSWFKRQLRTKMERWVVRSADEVICVTPTLAEMYRRRYPGARVTLIRNGYDRSEIRPHRPTAATDPFRIVYTGTLDRPAEFGTFLDGVSRLATRRPDLAKRLRIDIYGRVADGCRAIADRHAEDGLDGIVRFYGFVGRDEVLDALAAGDAALVLLGPGPGMDLFVPGKLYDYLGQDRPVLAMLPDGDARDLLEDIGWGTLARPEPDAVASAIERLIDGPAPTRPADPEGRFDRATLAEQLAGVLSSAVDPPRDARSRARS